MLKVSLFVSLCGSALAQTPGGGAEISAFLSRYCVNCHSDAKRTANLSLENGAGSDAVWEKVHDRLSSRRMPPPGAAIPSKTEMEAVTNWLEKKLGATGAGRVTARRLNRLEYNNTIRDLLGVAVRPADEFPLDDSGYGFDNIGDVLSVSPLLLEKYLAAARLASQAAIYGEAYPPEPAKLARFLSKKSQEDPTPGALSYSYRGAIYGSFRFPVDGEYELRMRVGNYRPRDVASTPRHRELRFKRKLTPAEQAELEELNRKAYPPVKMVATFDGAEVLSQIVEGNIDYQYAHGEAIARVKAKAGEHSFRASFPSFASLGNPLENVNLDGRRKLFIDYVDVVGPFHPVKRAANNLVFVCSEKTPECARRIVEQLARRAFRRPVTAGDVDPLVKLAASVRAAGDSFEESIRVAVQAVLVSPSFLFRIEREPAAVSEFVLSDHELASRLSYFLWSSMPDQTLRGLADSGRLRASINAQLDRMLADAKSDALMENFFGQWLGLRQLDKHKPDPKHFPTVDDELMESMGRETALFARAMVREDRSILDLLDARFTFVNGPLAAYYGIAGVAGEGFERVNVDGVKRGGVVTQGAVLTLSSYATRTSPVLRGKWVLENLLGTPPPPPPGDVPALPEGEQAKNVSLRKRLEQHRASAACSVCHDQMDPIGFGLENYDAAGGWRDRDGQFPIEGAGPGELKRSLKAQPELFTRNVVEKLMTYALGRGMEASDRAALTQIANRVAANGYRWSVLLREIVNSKAFQMQKSTRGAYAQR